MKNKNCDQLTNRSGEWDQILSPDAIPQRAFSNSVPLVPFYSRAVPGISRPFITLIPTNVKLK